ncbi:MAG: hypothetical protein ACK47N_10015 [Microcystis sp.]|uniref:hypothetical protein n=1 Tax=Microcystis TaxID=1125 RepID=UPI001681BEF6|nr:MULTISPECIES: hypothetical protein [Microcystis]MBD2291511.1 hypothetical protein [Microcystis wesenbergii FACHB-1317]UZO74702.1 hypothetical protein M8120_17705 [Microcystis aeruginosa str. Chao 1910]
MSRNSNILFFEIATLSLMIVLTDAATGGHLSLLAANPAPTTTAKYLPLSWEKTDKPHPERAAWSLKLSEQIDKHFAKYNSAKDINYFCPKYASLDKTHKIKAIGDIFVGLAYYESGFNPLSNDPDVAKINHPNNYEDYPEEWSVGLFQMSVVDQKAYNLNLGYIFDPKQDPNKVKLPPNELRQPLPNIVLATEVMAKMIDKHDVIRVSENPYWATLKPGGKYDKSKEIREWVLQYDPFCNQRIKANNSESSHKKLLIQAKNWKLSETSDLRIEPKSDTNLYFENLRGVSEGSSQKFVNQCDRHRRRVRSLIWLLLLHRSILGNAPCTLI